MSGKKKLNKKEASELLNKVFGVDVDWTKLSEYELTQLLTVIANPDALITRLGGYTRRDIESAMRGEIVSAVKELLKSWRGPIVSVLRGLASGEVGAGEGQREEGAGSNKE